MNYSHQIEKLLLRHNKDTNNIICVKYGNRYISYPNYYILITEPICTSKGVLYFISENIITEYYSNDISVIGDDFSITLSNNKFIYKQCKNHRLSHKVTATIERLSITFI